MSSDQKTRVAIVGCGGIARAHAKAYAANSDICRLVVSADTNASAAKAFGNEFGCAIYSDTTGMLDEVQPEALSICTPPASHLALTRLAAERGIAVLCEKPLARNQAEADEMVKVVQQSGITFMNGLCHRFHGPVNQLLKLLADGALGQPIHYYNRFAFRFGGVEGRWFTDADMAGGGVLLDTAVHSLDLFTYLMGDVASIQAHVSTTLPVKVEDSAALFLVGKSGVTGDISCSWVTPPGEALIRVYGTEGTAELDYNANPNLRYHLAGGDWIKLPYSGPDRFALEARHFIECVRSKTIPLVTVHDGARVIRLIEDAYAAAGVWRQK